MLSFFPPDVLDEILDLIESVLGVFLPTLANGKFVQSAMGHQASTPKKWRILTAI